MFFNNYANIFSSSVVSMNQWRTLPFRRMAVFISHSNAACRKADSPQFPSQKGNVKLFLLNKNHTMESCRGNGCIAPCILYLGTRWRWVVSFTPRPLYPKGKSLSYPLDRRLGGPQSRSGRGGEEKNSQPLPGLEPPIIQPIAQGCNTELSRLLFRFHREGKV
jgi:hypothetical protein